MDTIKKPLTLFEHLSGLTDKKRKWEDLSDIDRKSFSPYMINRFLSMDPGMIEFVDALQKYTIGLLDSKSVYNLYLDILPKKKVFLKYIKGDSKDSYDPKLLDYTAKYYECGLREAKEYLDIMNASVASKEQIRIILQSFGVGDKEIKKLMP